MKIYTKGGDKGKTSLVGGKRVSKAHERLNAYGTLDELMAHIGVLHDHLAQENFKREELQWVLSRVMDCAAILASEDETLEKLPHIDTKMIERLEGWTDNHMDGLPVLTKFTLPIGDPTVSYANVARTVCRRAEREIVKCIDNGLKVPAAVEMFVNRLSDYLYALGRSFSYEFAKGDIIWR